MQKKTKRIFRCISADLIHRVITLSGSSTAGWAVQRHQTSAWDLRNLVDYLRCEKTFQKQTLEKLQLTDRTDEGRCNLQEKTLSCFNVRSFFFFSFRLKKDYFICCYYYPLASLLRRLFLSADFKQEKIYLCTVNTFDLLYYLLS